MADLELSTDPGAMSVEEVALGFLVLGATTPPLNPDQADLLLDTVNAWRKIWPLCEASAAAHGVTMTQPIGFEPAVRIVAEAGVFAEAERAVTL